MEEKSQRWTNEAAAIDWMESGTEKETISENDDEDWARRLASESKGEMMRDDENRRALASRVDEARVASVAAASEKSVRRRRNCA